MENPKNDVKAKLRQAYIHLLTKKNFLDITVSDLVKVADVGRASFYRSYQSIDDVLEEIADMFYEKATTKILPMFFNDHDKALKILLSNLFTRIKETDNLNPAIFPDNVHYLLSRLAKKFEKELIRMENTERISEKYLLMVNVGITMSVARHWLHSGFKESTAEITEYTFQLIKNNIAFSDTYDGKDLFS